MIDGVALIIVSSYAISVQSLLGYMRPLTSKSESQVAIATYIVLMCTVLRASCTDFFLEFMLVLKHTVVTSPWLRTALQEVGLV